MNRLSSFLKKLIPGVLQIIVVVVILATAIIFYGLGSSGDKSASTSASDSQAVLANTNSASDTPNHPIDVNGDGTIYTCSMHPQILQDEPGDCPICGMDLVPIDVSEVTSAEMTDGSTHLNAKEPEVLGYACAMNCVPPLEEPGDCPVCGMEMQRVLEEVETGQVDGDPKRRYSMSPAAKALASIQTSVVQKRIPEKSIRLVGELAVDPSQRAHISADVGGRIDELSAEYEGDVVEKGEELILLYSPELLAVQQEFLQAKASLERLPNTTLDTVRRASVSAVNAARERLRLAGLSPDQIDAIAESGEAKEQVTLLAPIGGTITQRHAEEGQYIKKGERILSIANLKSLWAEMAAYESDLPWLHVGQPVTFTSEAFPGETFTGEVAWIDPTTNMRTRTTRVRLNVENERGLLRPGMYLTAQVQSTLGDEPMLVIPESAALITGERAVVYVEVPGTERPTYQGTEIILGPKVKEGYIVVSGLSEGQRVVTNGAFQIDSALQIVAKSSMMNPSGNIAMLGHDHDQGMAMPDAEEDRPEQPVHESNSQHGEHIAEVINNYLLVQEALAADDAEAATAAYGSLQSAASKAEMSQLRIPAEEGASVDDIEQQRVFFREISQHLIPMVREHGNPTDHSIRLVHCPMAFDFAGADWLQAQAEVRNPYFGASMLKCGTVEKEWLKHD